MSQNPHYGLVPKDFKSNLRYRIGVLEMVRDDPAVAADFLRMCSEDLLLYVNLFCWTSDPRMLKHGLPSKVPFITYDFQDDAMSQIEDCVNAGRDFAIPKSRDMGASWMGLTVFEWFWHFRPDVSFLLISRNEDYVDKSGNPKALFWKLDFLHLNQPSWLLPTGRWLGWKDPNRRLLHMGNADNGSVIDGESTTGDAGRGDRRTAMFIDEHAAFELNDGFKVLRASRDTTDCRGFNSTHQGRNTAFNKVIEETAAQVIRLHWSVHPEKNKGLYQADKETGRLRLLDDWRGRVEVRRKGEKEGRWVEYPEEYPFVLDGKLRSPWYDLQRLRCTSDAEIGQELDIDPAASEYQFFDVETIEALRKQYCRAPLLVGELEFDPETLEPKRFHEDVGGRLELWLTLDEHGRPSDDRRFTMGADVSAGTGASNSVASVADKKTGEKVAVWRDPNTVPTDFARQVVALGRWFNRAYLAWDRSGPTGETFSKRVEASGYSPVYFRREEKKFGRPVGVTPGYYLNSEAKTAVLEDYRDALGGHKFLNRSDRGMDECLEFVRCMDGRTVEHSAALSAQDPGGARTAHGDEVVADALCCLCLTEVSSDPRAGEPEIPMGSLAWRRERKRLAERPRDDVLSEGW